MESTEAKNSATVSVTDGNGFNWLLTFRDEDSNNLLKKAGLLSTWLQANKYTPQIKKTFGGSKPQAEIVPDRKCPECGQPLVYQTLKDGRKMIKCSTQKYDFTTKQSTGCKFVEWPDKLPDKIY